MEMAAQPMSSEAIALAEKKLDMTLDDIIKISKKDATKAKKSRASTKKQRAFNKVAKEKSSKLQGYMDSRAFLRQGALARKRSKIQGSHFQLATGAARNVSIAPLRGRAFRSHRADTNKQRSEAQVGQRAPNGGTTAKPEMQQLQGENAVPTRRPKTLDSLFANLKEQRMRALSRQNTKSGYRSTNSGTRRMPPWSQGRFSH